MAAGKKWDPFLHKWVKEDELGKEWDDFAELANLIGEEIAKRGITRDGMRELFRCVEERLTFGGFDPLVKKSDASTSEGEA